MAYRIKRTSLGFGSIEWIIFKYGDHSQTPLGTYISKADAAKDAHDRGFQIISSQGIDLFWCNSLQDFVTIPE